jgi:hypothetical protein
MKTNFGLTPDMLADGVSDIIKPPKEKPIQFASLTEKGDTAPRKLAQVVPDKKEKSGADLEGDEADTQKQIDELRTQQKKEKSSAAKAQYAKVYAQYEPQLSAPPPKFEAPKETFTQLAGLGAMMMMLGAMAGGKTYGSAIGAMNGLAGMFKGYQEGRKEAFDKAKTDFEQNLKSWKENKAQVKEAFQRALKLGATDLNKATTDVIKELIANGETTSAELVKKRGLPAAAQAFNVASENADKHFDAVQATVARLSPSYVGEKVALAGPPVKSDTTKSMTTEQKLKMLEDRLFEIKKQKSVRKAQEEEFKGSMVDIINPDTGRTEKMLAREYQKLRGESKAPQLAGEAKREKTDAEKRQEAMDEITKGVGARPTLARLLGPDVALATDEKSAKDIVDKLTSIRNTLDLVKTAQDPDIRFGEVGRTLDKLHSAFERNFVTAKESVVKKDSSAPLTPDLINKEIDKAAASQGLSPNDKNIVFYKEAIFTALELERSARGGSILPVAFMRTLTPLLDPKSQTRQQFTEIFMRRANEVARSSGLTEPQVMQGINNITKFQLSPSVIGGGPKPSVDRSKEITSLDQLQKAIRDNLVTKEEAEQIYNRLKGQ